MTRKMRFCLNIIEKWTITFSSVFISIKFSIQRHMIIGSKIKYELALCNILTVLAEKWWISRNCFILKKKDSLLRHGFSIPEVLSCFIKPHSLEALRSPMWPETAYITMVFPESLQIESLSFLVISLQRKKHCCSI